MGNGHRGHCAGESGDKGCLIQMLVSPTVPCVSLGCPGQGLLRMGKLLATPQCSALIVLPLCSGTCCLFRSFVVPRGGLAMAVLSQGASGSPDRSLRPAGGVGAVPHSLVLCWEVTGDVCACREPAEEEVQDPKARAKANWLRAFNKVCMQLQEVRTPWPLPWLRAGCTAPFHTWAVSRDIHGLGVPTVMPTTSFPASETPWRGREC